MTTNGSTPVVSFVCSGDSLIFRILYYGAVFPPLYVYLPRRCVEGGSTAVLHPVIRDPTCSRRGGGCISYAEYMSFTCSQLSIGSSVL